MAINEIASFIPSDIKSFYSHNLLEPRKDTWEPLLQGHWGNFLANEFLGVQIILLRCVNRWESEKIDASIILRQCIKKMDIENKSTCENTTKTYTFHRKWIGLNAKSFSIKKCKIYLNRIVWEIGRELLCYPKTIKSKRYYSIDQVILCQKDIRELWQEQEIWAWFPVVYTLPFDLHQE